MLRTREVGRAPGEGSREATTKGTRTHTHPSINAARGRRGGAQVESEDGAVQQGRCTETKKRKLNAFGAGRVASEVYTASCRASPPPRFLQLPAHAHYDLRCSPPPLSPPSPLPASAHARPVSLAVPRIGGDAAAPAAGTAHWLAKQSYQDSGSLTLVASCRVSPCASAVLPTLSRRPQTSMRHHTAIGEERKCEQHTRPHTTARNEIGEQSRPSVHTHTHTHAHKRTSAQHIQATSHTRTDTYIQAHTHTLETQRMWSTIAPRHMPSIAAAVLLLLLGG